MSLCENMLATVCRKLLPMHWENDCSGLFVLKYNALSKLFLAVVESG